MTEDDWVAWCVRRGVMSRAELEQEIFGQPVKPIYFSPLRNSLVIREGFELERRAAEERDRREWTEGVRRRLGLVAEVHRCWVWWGVEGTLWTWWCYRRRCPARGGAPSQPEAFAEALAHVRSLLPEPPEEPPVTELDILAFDALWASMRAEQDAFAAALPGRMEAVAGEINEYLAGVLPEGMRFEWVPDGREYCNVCENFPCLGNHPPGEVED